MGVRIKQMKRLSLIIAAILIAHTAYARRPPMGKAHGLPMTIEIKSSSYQNAADPINKVYLVKFKIIQEREFEEILKIDIVYIPGNKRGDMLRVPISTSEVIDEITKKTVRQGEFLITREMINGSKAQLSISTNTTVGTGPYVFLLDLFLEEKDS